MTSIRNAALLTAALYICAPVAHAGDWNKPALSDTYANFRQYLDDRLMDVAKGNDSAIVTITNTPTNMLRWNSASAKWQKYNGSSWVDMANPYAISISGNAATATTASATPWSGITSKPTTRDGYGITDVPKTNGTSATGTWAISITGNAAYATNAGSASTATSATNSTNATYATTQSSGTNNTTIATTSYVKNQFGTSYSTSAFSASTDYTNSSGRFYFVTATIGLTCAGNAQAKVDGIVTGTAQSNGEGMVIPISFIVPNGAVFRVDISGCAALDDGSIL